MVKLDKLVDNVHAAHLAFGKTEVSREDVHDIVSATITGLGLVVHELTGEVYEPAPRPVINYPNNQNGVRWSGQRRRRVRR